MIDSETRASMRHLAVTIGVLAGCSSPPSSTPAHPPSIASESVWAHWGDGQAEVNGYTIQNSRYGQTRPGEAVLVFVTETLSHSKRVKTDGNQHDTFPVMKLNAVHDFQTGLYDYNVMTSSFVPMNGETPRGLPTKISFSMQEWCGNTYAEATTVHDYGDPASAIRLQSHNYMDGQGQTTADLPLQPNPTSHDALPTLIRGIAGPLLSPGETLSVNLLPRMSDSHMNQRPWSWQPAILFRSQTPQRVTVPAGEYDAFSVRVEPTIGATVTYWVETNPPHRIIGWESDNGEKASLTGSIRTEYWNRQSTNHTILRSELGLPPRTWPPPTATD